MHMVAPLLSLPTHLLLLLSSSLSLPLSLLSQIEILVIGLRLCPSPGWFHLETLTVITSAKTVFPNLVTFTISGGRIFLIRDIRPTTQVVRWGFRPRSVGSCTKRRSGPVVAGNGRVLDGAGAPGPAFRAAGKCGCSGGSKNSGVRGDTRLLDVSSLLGTALGIRQTLRHIC